MSTIPFYRYVFALLLLNNNISKIQEMIRNFGFVISSNEIEKIAAHMSSVPIEPIKNIIVKGLNFDLSNETHVEYLKHVEVYEMYEYYSRQLTLFDEEPNYFKWIRDCEWILKHVDVSILVFTLMFNDEPLDSLSRVIKFKYKRFISIQALELFQSYYFDTSKCSAKEVFQYIPNMNKTSAIIRRLHNGESEIEYHDAEWPERNNGITPNINIVDSNYIKWKIGYKDVQVPGVKAFLADVQRDAMCKFYEAMNMEQSVEVEEESGEAGGAPVNIIRKRRRNTEDQKAKLAKHWLDIYIKATDKMPIEDGDADNFFDKIHQISLEFRNYETEKIAGIDSIPGMLEDIKGDV